MLLTVQLLSCFSSHAALGTTVNFEAVEGSCALIRLSFHCRSSTHALQAQQAGSDDLAKIVVIPEHAPAHHTNDSPNLPTGQEEQEGPSRRASSFQFRRTRRKRAAESILSSIRRHYATVVDVASYVGLGLVLYAGDCYLCVYLCMVGAITFKIHSQLFGSRCMHHTCHMEALQAYCLSSDRSTSHDCVTLMSHHPALSLRAIAETSETAGTS